MIFGADFECRVQKSGLCAKQWVGLFRTDLTVKGNTLLYILSGYFPGKHAHTYTRLLGIVKACLVQEWWI